MRTPWKHALLLLTFSLTCQILAGVSIMRCEDLHCYNDSPCRTVSSGNVFTAECLCSQGWTGDTCQTQLLLKVTDVTMTTVKLKVEGLDPKRSAVKSKSNHHLYNSQYLNSSLHYWKGNFSNLCNIIPVTLTFITVTGLQNNTEYTFCLITEETKMCNFDLVYHHGNMSYCTTAKTSDTKVVTIATGTVSRFVFYTFIVTCIVVVALSILIAVLIISIRKRYFTHLIGARNEKQRKSRSKTTSFMTEDSATLEEFLLITPTTNQRIAINPPSSPGKPKNQLVNTKARGFASFSAKDDQAIALSTVIEYGEVDANSEDSFYDNQDEHQQITFLGR